MFAVGDVVVCVDVSPCPTSGHPIREVKEGGVYRVRRITQGPRGPALAFFGVTIHSRSGGLWEGRFRKIQRADDQFIERVRACRPKSKETVR